MNQRFASPVLSISAAFLISTIAGCSRSDTLEYVNSAVWTRAYDVEIQGGFAYCSFLNGLGIIEIADQENPRLVSKLFLGGGFGIDIADGIVFIAAGDQGLQVIDVGDPTAPSVIAAHATTGEARDIVVAEGYAYVADGPAGLIVFDISDPGNPSVAGLLDTPGNAESIELRGGRAFIADGMSGLAVVDVANPTQPSMLAEFDTPGTAEDVALAGDYAYVVDGSSGLHVVNIAVPEEPRFEASVEAAGYAHGITISGNLAFIGNLYDADFEIYDISAPTAPRQVSTLKYAFPNEGWDVGVADNIAYVVDHFSGIFLVDISDLDSVVVVGEYRTPSFLVGLEILGDKAFTLGQELFGMTIVDIADPSAPTYLSRFNAEYSLRFPAGVAAWGNHAYVTERRRSAIVDFSNPAEPTRASMVPVPETARAVQVRGDYAYVTADNAGFFIMDISDPSAVEIAGSLEMPGFSYGVAVMENHAYVANSEYGLKVIDISDPTSPSLVASLQTPDNAYAIEVRGEFAYIADGMSGVQIVNVSNPMSPAVVGSLDLGGFINSIALSGDFAYVTDEDFGVRKIDISEAGRPMLVASYDTPGEPTDVAVVGDYVVVNDAFSLMVLR